jgi:GNAT superfamily N-acetyltransferase
VTVRPYSAADRETVLALASTETREALIRHLNSEPAYFFVLEHPAAGIVACGGYSFGPDRVATLEWGIVREDMRRQGLGRYLLLWRLKQVGASADHVRAVVPPPFDAFYLKNGFQPVGDALVRKLTVCS